MLPPVWFATHPHDNMEIITIPWWRFNHQDSMGHSAVIVKIFVISAGRIYHSATKQKVELLQLWIFPNQQNVNPRYDQIPFKQEENAFYKFLSQRGRCWSWIHQKTGCTSECKSENNYSLGAEAMASIFLSLKGALP